MAIRGLCERAMTAGFLCSTLTAYMGEGYWRARIPSPGTLGSSRPHHERRPYIHSGTMDDPLYNDVLSLGLQLESWLHDAMSRQFGWIVDAQAIKVLCHRAAAHGRVSSSIRSYLACSEPWQLHIGRSSVTYS
jgi:hypothetical protein